ncbi:MAG: hypothetical protein ACHP79_13485 [Terriglobales bacterium]
MAELNELLSRTVARLPAGMVTALAANAEPANSIASIIDLRIMDLRTIDLRNLISLPPDALPRTAIRWLGTAGFQAMILMLHAFCYTLSA